MEKYVVKDTITFERRFAVLADDEEHALAKVQNWCGTSQPDIVQVSEEQVDNTPYEIEQEQEG